MIYPILVTYKKYHKHPNPRINGGRPYADLIESEKYFDNEPSATGFVATMLRLHTGTGAQIHYGHFEVEES